MSKMLEVSYSAEIPAPPAKVYAIVADFNDAHKQILPKPYFQELTVTKGGIGAGTEYTVNMTVMGQDFTYQMIVSEPEPGRILVERDEQKELTTTWTIESRANGSASYVTIMTQSKASAGLMGILEKLLNPIVTRRIYKQELALLVDYVSKQSMG